MYGLFHVQFEEKQLQVQEQKAERGGSHQQESDGSAVTTSPEGPPQGTAAREGPAAQSTVEAERVQHQAVVQRLEQEKQELEQQKRELIVEMSAETAKVRKQFETACGELRRLREDAAEHAQARQKLEQDLLVASVAKEDQVRLKREALQQKEECAKKEEELRRDRAKWERAMRFEMDKYVMEYDSKKEALIRAVATVEWEKIHRMEAEHEQVCVVL